MGKVYLELGWKPISLLVAESKLKFIKRIKSPLFKGSSLVRKCMEWNEEMGTSLYYRNIQQTFQPYLAEGQAITEISLKQIQQQYEINIQEKIQSYKTLSLMPLPEVYWKKQVHVEEGPWSKILTKFCSMNMGLGIRDSYHKSYALSVENGRVVTCPICLDGPNDEIHLVMKCKVLKPARESITLENGRSLAQTLNDIRNQYHTESPAETLRYFLGEEPNLSRYNFIGRGVALDILVDTFFKTWSELRNRAVSRTRQRNRK